MYGADEVYLGIEGSGIEVSVKQKQQQISSATIKPNEKLGDDGQTSECKNSVFCFTFPFHRTEVR